LYSKRSQTCDLHQTEFLDLTSPLPKLYDFTTHQENSKGMREFFFEEILINCMLKK